eukprot:4511694-Pleurochrysis_carterae.AAC.5
MSAYAMIKYTLYSPHAYIKLFLPVVRYVFSVLTLVVIRYSISSLVAGVHVDAQPYQRGIVDCPAVLAAKIGDT